MAEEIEVEIKLMIFYKYGCHEALSFKHQNNFDHLRFLKLLDNC